MKKQVIKSTLIISIAILFTGCGGGGGGGSSDTGSTCNDHAGTYSITNTMPVTCTGEGVNLTVDVADTGTYTATQSGCSLTLRKTDGTITMIGSLSGDTWTYSENGSGSSDSLTYTYSENNTISFGSTLSGTSIIIQSYSNGITCTGNGVITGSKQ